MWSLYFMLYDWTHVWISYIAIRATCHVNRIAYSYSSSPWWWRQKSLPKLGSISTMPHGATSQKTVIFILVIVRISSLNICILLTMKCLSLSRGPARWQTRPLTTEGAQRGQRPQDSRLRLQDSKVWSWAPGRARRQDEYTDWPSLVTGLLTLSYGTTAVLTADFTFFN
jgi:hypothetical protein